MAETVADFVWQRLEQWGVRRVFGFPGDGINGLVGALARHPEIAMFSEEEIVPVWERAFAADRPVVVQARTDPSVPPLPPHITLKEATNLMKAMVGGDADLWSVVKQSAKQVVEGLTAGEEGASSTR